MREAAASILEHLVPSAIIGFLLFLLVAFVLRIPNTSTLNRVSLAPYPSNISIKEIVNGSFQSSFDRWMTDNFYKHSEIVKVHNQIEYSIFNDGVGDWIQGSDGYLFSKSQTIDAIGGNYINSTSWEDYLAYAQSIAHMQELLDANGKDFIVLLNPVKGEVYNDKLPWYEKLIAEYYENDDNTRRKMLIRALDLCEVNFYDTSMDLIAMRGQSDFDVFSKTGHHWTLTAAATEMPTIMDNFAKQSSYSHYPSVAVTGINNSVFDTDKDILNLLNVYTGRLDDRYTSPEITYIPTDSSAYIFGTSFGHEIVRNLFNDNNNKAFSSLVFQEYFTNVNECDADGSRKFRYNTSNSPDDVGVMRYVSNADVVIMEQQASSGVMDTHKKFVDYVTSCLETGIYTMTGSLLRDEDESKFKLVNFYGLEAFGRWNIGNDCSVLIYQDIGSSGGQLSLKMRVNAYGGDQIVDIYFNNVLIDTIEVTQSRRDYLILIPQDLVDKRINRLSFSLSRETTSPKTRGESEDSRILGLGFEELQIIARGEN